MEAEPWGTRHLGSDWTLPNEEGWPGQASFIEGAGRFPLATSSLLLVSNNRGERREGAQEGRKTGWSSHLLWVTWVVYCKWKPSLLFSFPVQCLWLSPSLAHSSGGCQIKVAPDGVKRAKKTIFNTLPIREFNSPETTGRGNFKSWGELREKHWPCYGAGWLVWLCHLCLLMVTYWS